MSSDYKIIVYLILAAAILVVIFLLKKVKPMISISGDKIKVQKYFIPQYISFDKIREIQMVAIPESIGAEFVIPIIKISFKFKMKTGDDLIINWSTEGWSGLNANKDNAVSLKPETIRRIYKDNPDIKLDQFTKDYIEDGTAEKFITTFRG